MEFLIQPLFPGATTNILLSSQQYYLLSQAGSPEASTEQRETENDVLKRELEVLKPELQLIKTEVICPAVICCRPLASPASFLSRSQAQRCVRELKSQVNRLEAEVEEQRAHRMVAAVENEQLRMEVEGLRSASVAGVGAQIGLKEADSERKELCPRGLSELVCRLHIVVFHPQRELRRRSFASLS